MDKSKIMNIRKANEHLFCYLYGRSVLDSIRKAKVIDLGGWSNEHAKITYAEVSFILMQDEDRLNYQGNWNALMPIIKKIKAEYNCIPEGLEWGMPVSQAYRTVFRFLLGKIELPF